VDGLLGLIVGGLAVLGAAGIRQLMAGRR
jgi:hypothetical protein